MAEVTSISADAWCRTEAVRDRLRLKVGQENPDWETEIREATDTVQSMWSEVAGQAVGSPGMPTSDAELDSLLQQATAYMAASEGHLKYSQNIRSGNDNGQRHVFLEKKAKEKFDQWQAKADFDPEDADDRQTSGTDLSGRTKTLDPFGD